MKFGGNSNQPKQLLSQHPPKVGSHKPTDIQRINGGHGAGNQSAVVHSSLKKPGR